VTPAWKRLVPPQAYGVSAYHLKGANLAHNLQTFDMPHAEQVSFAGLLTATGGFLDAFTFVGHGHVFANSMTGNVVLLGLAAGTGDFTSVWWHLVPILAFIVGVAAAHVIRLKLADGPVGRVEQISLWLEIGFLSLVALLPHEIPDEAIIVGIAFVAAVQSTSFTRVRGGGYNSTMTTGNLRRFAEMLFKGLVPKRDSQALWQARTFAVICLCFLGGAMIGGFTTPRLGNSAVAVPTLALLFLQLQLWMALRPAR